MTGRNRHVPIGGGWGVIGIVTESSNPGPRAQTKAMSGMGGYVLKIEQGMAGAGNTIWRWQVCSSGNETVVLCGATFRSHEAAEQAAREAIETLAGKGGARRPGLAYRGR